MANPTDRVPAAVTPFTEDVIRWDLAATVQIYYPNEMIGLDSSGNATKFDDTASLMFAGLVADSVRIEVFTGDSAGTRKVKVTRPKYLQMLIASAAATDVGKLVYARFSNEVQFASGTYGNLVGRVVKRLSATAVLIEPTPFGRVLPGAQRTLAATGAQSITRYDLNKTIFIPNTAAFTITLPAVAGTQAGDFLTFVKTTADAFAATLDGDGSETIDGAATLATIDAQYDTATLVSTGSAWIVVSRDIA